MVTQDFSYPSSSTVTVSAVGTDGLPIPSDSILIGGEDPSGNLHQIQVDASGNVIIVDGDPITPKHVIVDSSALPTGAATEAKQDTGNASLSSIDTKLTSPLTVTGPLTDTQLRATAVPVSGPLTDAELRATPIDVDTGLLQGLTDAELRATPVPVSGTVSTGGLTDAELRATPVDVDTGLLQGLTDAELRATPVPVSGTVSTGGLTDAELRATPVPVSGTVTVTQATGTNLHAVLDAGSAIIGAVSIDQTTPGTTNAVSATNLPTTADTNYGAAGASTLRAAAQVGNATGAADFGAGAAGAQTLRVVAASGGAAPSPSTGRSLANAPARNDYTSSPVTTGAYVQLVASTTSTTNKIQIFDSSGQTMALAVGAAASEVIQCYIFPGGQGDVELAIPSGSRVSIIAISATAAVGEIDINFLT